MLVRRLNCCLMIWGVFVWVGLLFYLLFRVGYRLKLVLLMSGFGLIVNYGLCFVVSMLLKCRF